MGSLLSSVGSPNPNPENHDDLFVPVSSVSSGFRLLQARFVSVPVPMFISNDTEKKVKKINRNKAIPSNVLIDTSISKKGMITVSDIING